MYAVEIPVTDLREGMLIATKINEKTHRVLKSEKVREIVHVARGCRNTHVNGDQCWDRCATVNVVL